MFSGRRIERAWSGCRRGRAGGCELSSVPARGAGERAQRLKAQTVPTEDKGQCSALKTAGSPSGATAAPAAPRRSRHLGQWAPMHIFCLLNVLQY